MSNYLQHQNQQGLAFVQAIEKKRGHLAQFIPTRDSRNRRIPGLYELNGKFYGYLLAEDKTGKPAPRRFPLIKT